MRIQQHYTTTRPGSNKAVNHYYRAKSAARSLVWEKALILIVAGLLIVGAEAIGDLVMHHATGVSYQAMEANR